MRTLDQRDAPAATDLWRVARSCSETVGNDDEVEVGQTISLAAYTPLERPVILTSLILVKERSIGTSVRFFDHKSKLRALEFKRNPRRARGARIGS